MNTILVEDINAFHLFYKSIDFVEGLVVTGYLIYPDLHKGSVFTFTEMGDGIYSVTLSLDSQPPNSGLMGKYGLVLKENGKVRKFEIFGFSVKGSEV